ncbi:MAG TPA: PASTA domain-containing protein [Gemmatimonadales bacterium]
MTRRLGLPRRVATVLCILAGAAAAGYVATCAIFPAPLLPTAIAVPSLRTLPTDSAMARLSRLGLRGRLADTTPDPMTPVNTVAWQSPSAETMLPSGATVRLGISAGAPVVIMPDVMDFDLYLARDVLAAAGLQVSAVDTVRHDAEIGTVVSTVPAPHSAMHPGDSVRLSVSAGAATIAVPNLVGLTVAAARDRIAALGLRVGALDQRFDGVAGTVLAQKPAAGGLVSRESSVDLTISGTMP